MGRNWRRAQPQGPAPRQFLTRQRTIAWLNRCRRLAKDWENRNRKALAFLRLASIRIMCSENFVMRPKVSGQTLTLQLRSSFYVGSAGFGLMCASPEGPCDDVGGPDASLRKTNSDAPDFLN